MIIQKREHTRNEKIAKIIPWNLYKKKGIFTVTKENDGNYYFTLKSKNGQLILNSLKHISLFACKDGIETIRASAIDNLKYDYKKTFDGKFYFSLKSVYGEVLGNSKLYETAENRNIGIEAVWRTAPLAIVINL